MKISKLFVVILVLALLSSVLLTSNASALKPPYVNVQILAVNDFHGALDTSLQKPSSSTSTWYYRGGAEYLANFVNTFESYNPNTVKISAGDMIGASPLLSALFHDEPTVMAFNQMGFDYSTTGNHEFDEGWQELYRMQEGGCHPVDGCFAGVPAFPGAAFDYLSANVIRLDNGLTLFPAYDVQYFDGVKVGFLGIAYEYTPSIVTASGVEGLLFEAEVETINHYVKVMKDEEELKAIVVILHNGAGAGPTINTCNTADSFYTNVVMNIDPEVDVLINGHTHSAYNCQVQVKKNYAPMLVTSAGYNGRYMTDIDLTIAGTNGQVVFKTATNVPVETPYLSATPNAAMKAMLDLYRAAAAPMANRIVGRITADIKRAANPAGESALGDVIADAQLAATSGVGYGEALVAMTNPGGIRTDLLFSQISGGELPGQVTFAEAFAVQPFSNSLVTMTLTGAQLKAVLEQQVLNSKMLQVSASLTYTWTASATAGSKVSELKIDGVYVDPAASYRVTVNNFLAGGGDGFTALIAGTNLLYGAFDVDAFVDYIDLNSPVPPGPQNRITLLP